MFRGDIERVRIDVEEAREILNVVRALGSIKYSEMSHYLNISVEEIQGFLNGRRNVVWSRNEKKIRQFIFRNILENADIQVLTVYKWPHIFSAIAPPINKAGPIISNMIGVNQFEVSQFENRIGIRRDVNRNRAYYLIIRATERGTIIVSSMRIYASTKDNPCPVFGTWRPGANDEERRVEGYIFPLGEVIYSFGYVRGQHTLRSAVLNWRVRGERNDFVGVRAGVSPNKTNRPFTYKIYCYQLVRVRAQQTVARLLGHHENWHKSELMDEIDGLDRIVEELVEPTLRYNGLLS